MGPGEDKADPQMRWGDVFSHLGAWWPLTWGSLGLRSPGAVHAMLRTTTRRQHLPIRPTLAGAQSTFKITGEANMLLNRPRPDSMLSVSCDVAYLLFPGVGVPLNPPHLPHPPSYCLPAYDSLQTQTQNDSQAVGPWASYLTSLSLGSSLYNTLNDPLKLLRGIQEKWLANSARVGP